MTPETDSESVHQAYSDPVFVHSKRESIELLVAFFVFLLWSVGVSYMLGYGADVTEATQTVWGMPRWVFWGVAVPWMGANVYTVYFCVFRIADDPLEDLSDFPPPNSQAKDAT